MLLNGTFDAYLYQLIENKQRFISQVMTGKTPVRMIEDVDEATLNYAEIKAIASGNPLIMERAEIETQIAKLTLLKQSHYSEIYDIENKIKNYYPSEINGLENMIIAVKKDIEHAKENTKPNADKFSPMIINNKTYTEKAEAGKAILKACENMQSSEPIPIGEYRGFKMQLSFDSYNKEFKITLRNEFSYYTLLGTDVHGNIQRLDNVIEALGNRVTEMEDNLAGVKTQFENAKEEVEKPFTMEEDLKQKTKRMHELDIALKMKDNKKEVIDIDSEEDIEEEKPVSKQRVYTR